MNKTGALSGRTIRRRLSTDELLGLEGTVHWDGDLDAMRDDAGPAP